jgi:hypothetical protein
VSEESRPRLRGIWTLEDLAWSLWLLVLAPASGGLFLDGGRATWFLTLAAAGFALALATDDRGAARPPVSRWIVLLGGGTAIILVDAGLRQLDAAIEWRIGTTIAAVVLVAIVWWQRRRERALVQLPPWVRRVLVWPYLMTAAEVFSGLAAALVGPSMFDVSGSATIGQTVFGLAFVGLVVMPLLFTAFVVAPRRIVHRDDAARVGTWALRYVTALASAAVSTWVLDPLLD